MEEHKELTQPVIINEFMPSETDSDAGLPPPIPVKKPVALPNLRIGGLGLSTLSKNGGMTSE